jgi:hypothetical protein
MYAENFPDYDPNFSFAGFRVGDEVGYHVSGSSTYNKPAYFGRAEVVGYDPILGRLFVTIDDGSIQWFEQGHDQVLAIASIPKELVR